MNCFKQSLYEESRSRFVALVFVGDLMFVALSMLVGCVFGGESLLNAESATLLGAVFEYWNHYCLGLLVYVVWAHNKRLYRWKVMLSRARAFVCIVKVAVLWSFSVLGISLILGLEPIISLPFIVVSAGLLVIFVTTWRLGMHWMLHHSPAFQNCYRNMVIVGTGTDAQHFANRLVEGGCGLYRFNGYIATQNSTSEEQVGVLGQVDDLGALMEEGLFGCVAVADVDMPRSQLVGIAKLCEQHYVNFKAIPKSFEVFSSCLEIVNIGGIPLMSLMEMPQNRTINRLIKRIIDIVGASFGLLLCMPLFVVLISLIKRESPGPAFYRQVRVGQGGREFKIIKLRSMKLDAEVTGAPGWSTQNDPRRLKIGSFMRKWNLDEVPQFWNVLKGDMSLVGPRPERPELINEFIKEIPYYQSRHTVKPGMTGWAQVNGLRGDTSISDRIRHDLQYIERWSVWMDLTIKVKTFFNYKGAC